jgi:hypothetical protein
VLSGNIRGETEPPGEREVLIINSASFEENFMNRELRGDKEGVGNR